MYDISNLESFKNCKYWLENIKTYADENVVIALVANKTDVLHVNIKKREVSKELAEKFARDNNLIFIGESSALSNHNIKEVMDALYERIFMIQSELIRNGKKRRETLKISEEELMLNNHRCCY